MDDTYLKRWIAIGYGIVGLEAGTIILDGTMGPQAGFVFPGQLLIPILFGSLLPFLQRRRNIARRTWILLSIVNVPFVVLLLQLRAAQANGYSWPWVALFLSAVGGALYRLLMAAHLLTATGRANFTHQPIAIGARVGVLAVAFISAGIAAVLGSLPSIAPRFVRIDSKKIFPTVLPEKLFKKTSDLRPHEADSTLGMSLPPWGYLSDQVTLGQFSAVMLADLQQREVILLLVSAPNAAPISLVDMLEAIRAHEQIESGNHALKKREGSFEWGRFKPQEVGEEMVDLPSGRLVVQRVNFPDGKNTGEGRRGDLVIGGRRAIILGAPIGPEFNEAAFVDFLNGLLSRNSVSIIRP